MVSSFVKSATAAVAMLIFTAEAHNKMTKPPPSWPSGFYNQNSPSSIIDPTTALPCPDDMSYNTDAASNTKSFWTAFNASSYKSLREFAWKNQKLEKGASNECGFSIVDGTPQDLPDMIQWDFFSASHQGPFEAYCDDTLVAKSWNAAVEYPQTPANVPYDKIKCKGASVLTSFWYALHVTPWQVYTNCAALTGATSSTKSNTSTSTSSSDTSQTAAQTSTLMPATPAVQQEEQTEDSTKDDAEEVADKASTKDDETVLASVKASPTDKCSVRRRHP